MIEGLERIGFHLPSLIIYSVNFAILTAVLYAIAFRPMLAGIRRRSEERAEAEALLQEAEAHVAAQHAASLHALAEARDEAASIVESALQRARTEYREAVERGLAQVRARSAADLHAQRERLQVDWAALVASAAERVLREALGSATQRALVESALREIAGTEVAETTPPPGLISVTSAVALTVAEWTAVGEALRSLFGEYPSAVHHVRPEVLGGLAVEVGDTVIDATVLGKLHQLQAELEQSKLEYGEVADADADGPD